MKKNLCFILCLLFSSIASGPVWGLEAMDSKAMSKVTGREGLAADLNLDASIQSLEYRDSNGHPDGSGNGVLRIGDGNSNINIDDGSGNSASLTGLSYDADGSGEIVTTLPTGSFTIDLPDWTLVDSFSSPSGSTSFGNISINGISPGHVDGNSLRWKAPSSGEGLRLNFGSSGEEMGEIGLGSVVWTDPDGTNGNSASAGLDNLRIRDTEYSNWHFEGFALDADGSNGIVLSVLDSGNEDDMGIATNIQTNGTTLFDLRIGGGDGGIVPRGSSLSIQGNDDGIILTPTVKVSSIDRVRFIDPDGFGSSSSSDLRSEGIQIGDVFGVTGVDPANLGPHTINVDSTQGIVIDAPGRSTSITPLDVSIPTGTVGGNDDMLKVDFSNIDWRGSSVGFVPGGDNGAGITLNLNLQLTLNEIRITDTDGLNGTNAGFFSVGYRGTGQGITIDDGSGNPADLSGMTLDVDETYGAELNIPDGSSNFGNVTAVIDKATLGDASTELGSFDARDMNFQGSTVRIGSH